MIPQVRTCSVAVPGTSKNNGSEDQELTGDRSLGDPCPGAVFSACRPSNLNDSEQEETHHMVTGVQEEIPHCSPGTLSGKQKKAHPTSQPKFRSENATATTQADQSLLGLQQMARPVIQPISTTISTESRSCRNPSKRQCPRLTGNQRNSNCLKICSKQV